MNILLTSYQYLQHTTEWAIPYENVEPCLRKLRKYFHEILVDPRERPHFPIEIRFSAPDDIWLSPSYNQQTCWIGIVQYKWVVTQYCLCVSQYSLGRTASIFLTESCSKGLRIYYQSIKVALIGRKLTKLVRRSFELYIPTSKISCKCYRKWIRRDCFVTSTCSAIFSDYL